jgi:molecular chaperone GrpE
VLVIAEMIGSRYQAMFGRIKKVMPEQERESTVLEPLETGPDSSTDQSAIDSAAIDPATELPARGGEVLAGSAETVSRAEFEQLKTERDQLLDRVARVQAEFDNARKRTERERIEYRDYAAGSVIEQFLPVLDHFELALKATGSVEQLRSGVELIVKQMEEILRQMQVVPVSAVGELFDPRVHEALGTVDRDDLPDQHVAEEIRRGYRLRDRLLRPALVRVAHNPKQVNE